MDKITEIRWHGRGGQGAKSAAMILAEAVFEEGKYIQSFPEYGSERAGAPVKAFNRFSDEKITIHSSVEAPDIVAVLDPTLLDAVNVAEGLGDDGILIVNTDKTPDDIRKKLDINSSKVFTVNATKISLDIFGRAIPNTPMMAAVIKATNIVSLDALKKKFADYFTKKLGQQVVDKNIQAMETAHKEVIEG